MKEATGWNEIEMKEQKGPKRWVRRMLGFILGAIIGLNVSAYTNEKKESIEYNPSSYSTSFDEEKVGYKFLRPYTDSNRNYELAVYERLDTKEEVLKIVDKDGKITEAEDFSLEAWEINDDYSFLSPNKQLEDKITRYIHLDHTTGYVKDIYASVLRILNKEYIAKISLDSEGSIYELLNLDGTRASDKIYNYIEYDAITHKLYLSSFVCNQNEITDFGKVEVIDLDDNERFILSEGNMVYGAYNNYLELRNYEDFEQSGLYRLEEDSKNLTEVKLDDEKKIPCMYKSYDYRYINFLENEEIPTFIGEWDAFTAIFTIEDDMIKIGKKIYRYDRPQWFSNFSDTHKRWFRLDEDVYDEKGNFKAFIPKELEVEAIVNDNIVIVSCYDSETNRKYGIKYIDEVQNTLIETYENNLLKTFEPSKDIPITYDSYSIDINEEKDNFAVTLSDSKKRRVVTINQEGIKHGKKPLQYVYSKKNN